MRLGQGPTLAVDSLDAVIDQAILINPPSVPTSVALGRELYGMAGFVQGQTDNDWSASGETRM